MGEPGGCVTPPGRVLQIVCHPEIYWASVSLSDRTLTPHGTLFGKRHVRLSLDAGPRLLWPFPGALLALTIKFFQEIMHVLPNIFNLAEADLILTFCCRWWI